VETALREYQTGNMDIVRFEILMAVTMKNDAFWDIKTGSYITEDTLRLHYRAQPINAM
jgi:hypothetical protein